IQLELRPPSALPANMSLAISVPVSENAGVPPTAIPDLHSPELGHEGRRPTGSFQHPAKYRRFSQGTIFAFGFCVGWKLEKKSTASTRKAADKQVSSRLDFERALPNKGSARLVYCSSRVAVVNQHHAKFRDGAP
ncbi:hypothetical protein O988_06097, partial [Pseudogymnoascus sp. VKM F-3808]